ncbi:MAG: hypothetical protein ABIN89_25755 [Chitinophagaceae bacterium]
MKTPLQPLFVLFIVLLSSCLNRKQIATIQFALPESSHSDFYESEFQEALLSEVNAAFESTANPRIKLVDFPTIEDFSDSALNLAAGNKIKFIILLSNQRFTTIEGRDGYNSVVTCNAFFTLNVFDVHKKKLVINEDFKGEGHASYENFPMLSLYPNHVQNPQGTAMNDAIKSAAAYIDFSSLVHISRWDLGFLKVSEEENMQ